MLLPWQSDDLHDLEMVRAAVRKSDVLVVVQSAHVFERPWCLLEMVTAIEHGIPIVCCALTTGSFAFSFDDSVAFLQSLDVELESKNPGATALLDQHGVPLLDVTWKLSSMIPRVISIGFSPSASRNVLSATISDIVEAIRNARPLSLEPKEEWQRRRLAPSLVGARQELAGYPLEAAQGTADSTLAATPLDLPEGEAPVLLTNVVVPTGLSSLRPAHAGRLIL